MTKKNKQIGNTEVALPPSPREAFLAAHPKEAAVWSAQIAEIVARLSAFRERVTPVLISFFDSNKDELWQIGVFIANAIEGLPGKVLTPDFYEQHKHEFAARHGQRISLETLLWLAGIARKYPDGVPTAYELLQIWKQVPLFLSDNEEFRLEPERPPQKLAAAVNPYMNLAARLQIDDWREDIEAFRKHPQFGDLASLKGRREDLHFELRRKFGELHEFSGRILKELGE